MRLYFDFGNTFIKWALDSANADIDYDALKTYRCRHTDISEAIAFIRNNHITHVSIASPRQSSAVAELSGFLDNQGIPYHRISVDPNLFNISYDKPQSFGVDRFLNLIGANAISNTPYCVISAGTATTVDFYDGKQHHGGAIFVGVHSQIEKIYDSTGLIFQLDDSHSGLLLGKSTQQSLTVGLLTGYKLMLNSYIENVCTHLKIKFSPLYTGGNAKLISENMNNIDYNLNFLGVKIYNKMMGI